MSLVIYPLYYDIHFIMICTNFVLWIYESFWSAD